MTVIRTVMVRPVTGYRPAPTPPTILFEMNRVKHVSLWDVGASFGYMPRRVTAVS